VGDVLGAGDAFGAAATTLGAGERLGAADGTALGADGVFGAADALGAAATTLGAADALPADGDALGAAATTLAAAEGDALAGVLDPPPIGTLGRLIVVVPVIGAPSSAVSVAFDEGTGFPATVVLVIVSPVPGEARAASASAVLVSASNGGLAVAISSEPLRVCQYHRPPASRANNNGTGSNQNQLPRRLPPRSSLSPPFLAAPSTTVSRSGGGALAA
jgi:hypothetical protein